MSPGIAVAVTVLLLIGNAFFVGAEFALISARRTQIEPRAENGSGAAKITIKAMENVTQMLAGAQLGVTVCSLALGAISEPAIAHLIEPLLHKVNISESLLHPISFVIALTIVVFAVSFRMPQTLRLPLWTGLLLAVEVVQIIVGLWQARTGLPIVLVNIHMVLAVTLVSAMTAVLMHLKAPRAVLTFADGSTAGS